MTTNQLSFQVCLTSAIYIMITISRQRENFISFFMRYFCTRQVLKVSESPKLNSKWISYTKFIVGKRIEWENELNSKREESFPPTS